MTLGSGKWLNVSVMWFPNIPTIRQEAQTLLKAHYTYMYILKANPEGARTKNTVCWQQKYSRYENLLV